MINKEEFRDLIRDIVREELGERSRFKIGTIASTSGKPTVTFAGESEPSEKQYSFLNSYVPFEGDRVLLARMGSTYVVLGKIDQGQEPMSGSNDNGHWIRYPDGTQVCWHRSDRLIQPSTSTMGDSAYWGDETFNYPMPFTEVPHVNSYSKRTNGLQWTGEAEVEQEYCRLYLFTVGEGYGGYLGYTAIGKWKE